VALNSVQVLGPKPETKTTGGRTGGGAIGRKLGMVAGGIAGGIAGAPTGAGAVAGAMAGAAGGASVGEMAGEMVSPTVAAKQEAVQRRLGPGPQMSNTSDQTKQLRQSLVALKGQPPEVQKEYLQPLGGAYMQSLANDQKKGVA